MTRAILAALAVTTAFTASPLMAQDCNLWSRTVTVAENVTFKASQIPDRKKRRIQLYFEVVNKTSEKVRFSDPQLTAAAVISRWELLDEINDRASTGRFATRLAGALVTSLESRRTEYWSARVNGIRYSGQFTYTDPIAVLEGRERTEAAVASVDAAANAQRAGLGRAFTAGVAHPWQPHNGWATFELDKAALRKAKGPMVLSVEVAGRPVEMRFGTCKADDGHYRLVPMDAPEQPAPAAAAPVTADPAPPPAEPVATAPAAADPLAESDERFHQLFASWSAINRTGE